MASGPRYLAAVDLDALPDADEAVTTSITAGGAHAVIADFDLEFARPVLHRHICLTGARMLQRIGQALLGDPISGEVDLARQLDWLTVDMQPDRQAGASDIFGQRVETVQTGLRHELSFIPVAPHCGQQ